MPRSKKNKEENLQKVSQKSRLSICDKRITSLRNCIEKYNNVILFSFNIHRNNFMRIFREEIKENSELFVGKNKLFGCALGRNAKDELRENVHLIAQRLVGNRGVIFTNMPIKKIIKKLDNSSELYYARHGSVATKDVELKEGPLEQFPFSMDQQLRKLGLPTELKKGTIHLYKSHTVCKKGDVLNAEQARILQLLGEKMSEVKLIPEFTLDKKGSFEDLGRAPADLPLYLNPSGFADLEAGHKNNRTLKKEGKEVNEDSDDDDEEMETDDDNDENES